MQMTLPAGSSLTESIEVSRLAEKALMDKFPEIKHVVAKIGTAEVPTDPMAVEDADAVSYTHLDVYKRQTKYCTQLINS